MIHSAYSHVMHGALLCLALIGAAHAQTTIDQPRAGWRHSAGEKTGFVQPVHYPASSVNTEDAQQGALIAGRIAATPKGAATLVVNGVAMPLLVNDDGTFARPYAFGKGSNSIEVRDANGKQRVRRQFYDAYADKVPARLRIVLSWDTDATDCDLHVVTPTGEHAWYGNRILGSGGAIDVDVTTGYGPEIFAHPTPARGTYYVYVNYYGAGENRNDITIAQVAIVSGENTAREKQQVFRVPLRKPGELLLVHSFVYP